MVHPLPATSGNRPHIAHIRACLFVFAALRVAAASARAQIPALDDRSPVGPDVPIEVRVGEDHFVIPNGYLGGQRLRTASKIQQIYAGLEFNYWWPDGRFPKLEFDKRSQFRPPEEGRPAWVMGEFVVRVRQMRRLGPFDKADYVTPAAALAKWLKDDRLAKAQVSRTQTMIARIPDGQNYRVYHHLPGTDTEFLFRCEPVNPAREVRCEGWIYKRSQSIALFMLVPDDAITKVSSIIERTFGMFDSWKVAH